MFYGATSVVLLAMLALCSPTPASHDQYVDELLQHLQAAYGKTTADQDTRYDDRRHLVTSTGERREMQQPREASETNQRNQQQTTDGHGYVGQVLKRANEYNGPLKGRPNAFFSRQNRHAPQFGQLQQVDTTNKLRGDYESDDRKRQVDNSLGHVLNKENNYGMALSNSRQHRNVPELGELQESGASTAANVDGKLGHVLNQENHYGMPSSDETQPAALTAHHATGEPDNKNRASGQHGTNVAATSAERRRNFRKLLPDKIYRPKTRVHRSA